MRVEGFLVRMVQILETQPQETARETSETIVPHRGKEISMPHAAGAGTIRVN